MKGSIEDLIHDGKALNVFGVSSFDDILESASSSSDSASSNEFDATLKQLYRGVGSDEGEEFVGLFKATCVLTLLMTARKDPASRYRAMWRNWLKAEMDKLSRDDASHTDFKKRKNMCG